MKGFDDSENGAEEADERSVASDGGENGEIACPTRDTTIMLTKGSALATTTLADPPKDRDGLTVTVSFSPRAAAATRWSRPFSMPRVSRVRGFNSFWKHDSWW